MDFHGCYVCAVALDMLYDIHSVDMLISALTLVVLAQILLLEQCLPVLLCIRCLMHLKILPVNASFLAGPGSPRVVQRRLLSPTSLQGAADAVDGDQSCPTSAAYSAAIPECGPSSPAHMSMQVDEREAQPDVGSSDS